MEDKKTQFLPFHAVNEFMRDDYRLEVIRTTLVALPTLPESHQKSINRLTRKLVKVPGFRNSAKAPAPLRAKSTTEPFEKSPKLTAAILSAWAEAHPRLRQQVHDMLSERGWDVLPPDADRTKLPGFMIIWPQGEDFETLNAAFAEIHSDDQASSDDISLMVVWISTRLPYQTEGEELDDNADDG